MKEIILIEKILSSDFEILSLYNLFFFKEHNVEFQSITNIEYDEYGNHITDKTMIIIKIPSSKKREILNKINYIKPKWKQKLPLARFYIEVIYI